MIVSTLNNLLLRQAIHWKLASERLLKVEDLASPNAWYGIDNTIANTLISSFRASINQVLSQANSLISSIEKGEVKDLHKQIIRLKNNYIRTEQTIHYYSFALNSRVNPKVASLLRACDLLCKKSMDELLRPLGKQSPYVLTFLDKGVGASILKAGLRLWDGNVSPVAAIKITQHNLFRPTSIIHETGHQVAHILGWVEEVKIVINEELKNVGRHVVRIYSSWSSEMVADAFAFAHTGYASVSALHDVISGSKDSVFNFNEFDPHPISYIRLLINTAMCSISYGSGPWDELEFIFKELYDLKTSTNVNKGIIESCSQHVVKIANILLKHKFACFGNNSLSAIINPIRVSPTELHRMELIGGSAIWTSHSWLTREPIRLLSLNGLKIATSTNDPSKLYQLQENWMTKLGFTAELN